MVLTNSCTARGGLRVGGRGGGERTGSEGTCSFIIWGGEGLGIDAVRNDSRFDFLSQFTEDNDEEVVPDSFFINDQSSPYTNVNLNCNYLDTDEISKLNSEKITVFSVNIQSLPAKFSELSETINEFSSAPDVICLQETWQIIDNSFFPLANYHTLETNLRSSAKGGGGRYLYKKLLSI